MPFFLANMYMVRQGGQCRFRKSSSTIAVSLSGLTCPLLTPTTSDLRELPLSLKMEPEVCAPPQRPLPPLLAGALTSCHPSRQWGVTVGWATPLGNGFSKSSIPSVALFLLHKVLQAQGHCHLLLLPLAETKPPGLLGLPNLCVGRPDWLSHSFKLR